MQFRGRLEQPRLQILGVVDVVGKESRSVQAGSATQGTLGVVDTVGREGRNVGQQWHMGHSGSGGHEGTKCRSVQAGCAGQGTLGVVDTVGREQECAG